jgi:hypothetical protein
LAVPTSSHIPDGNRVNTSVKLQDLRDFPAPAWFGEIMQEARVAHQEGRLDLSLPPGYGEPKPSSPRPRKPSIRKMIAAAERTGKKVTSVTTPEGVTLRFGESEPTEASNNPWLDDLKVTKQ